MDIDREDIQFIAMIRHEFTNYDRLCAYYSHFRDERTKLNQTITALMREWIDIPTFRERVKAIEGRVDLTKKRIQKKFIKKQMKLLRKTGYYTDQQMHAIAQRNLQNSLQLQKSIDLGDYRPELTNSDFWGTYKYKN